MYSVKKNRTRLVVVLMLLIMAMSGFFVLLGQNLFASAIETPTEEYYDFSEWNDHENSVLDDGMNYQEYSAYLNKYNTNEEVIVVMIGTGVCSFHPMLKGRIATVKEDDVLSYVDSNGKERYEYTLKKGDLLGFAVAEQASHAFSYKDYVGINPNIPLDYQEYAFEDSEGVGTQEAIMLASLTPTNVKILPLNKKNTSYSNFQDNFLIIKQLIKKHYNIVGVHINFGAAENKTDMDYDCTVEGKQTFKEMIVKHVDELREKYGVLTCFPSGTESDPEPLDDQAKGVDSAIVAGYAEGPVVHNEGTENEYESYVIKNSGHGRTRDFTASGVNVRIVDFEFEEVDGEKHIDPSKISFDLTRTGNGPLIGSIAVMSMIANYNLDKNYYNEKGELLYSRGEFADKIEQRIIDGCINPTNSKEEIAWNENYGWGIVSYTGYQIEINHTATMKIECVYDGQVHLPVYTSNVECEAFYGLTEDGEYNLTEEEIEQVFKNATAGTINVYYMLVAKEDSLDEEGNTTFFKKTTGVVEVIIKPIEITIRLADYVVEKGGAFSVENCAWVVESGKMAKGETLQLKISSNVDVATVGEYNITASCDNPNYNVKIISAKVSVVEPIDDIARKIMAIFIAFGTVVFLFVMIVVIKSINLKRKKNY